MLSILLSLTKVALVVFFLNGCTSPYSNVEEPFVGRLPAEEAQKIKERYSKEIAAMRNMIDELPQVFSDDEYRKKWRSQKTEELDSYSFYHLEVSNGRVWIPVIDRYPAKVLGSHGEAAYHEGDLRMGRRVVETTSGNIPVYFCQIIKPYLIIAEFIVR